MSTAPKAAAFAVLLRFLFNGAPMFRDHWIILIEILAVLSMTIGNLGALLQSDVKRLLAYSFHRATPSWRSWSRLATPVTPLPPSASTPPPMPR